jgi:hypothetical protein
MNTTTKATRQREPKTDCRGCSPPAPWGNGADLYEDEAMRLLVVLASFSAVIGVAVPAHADAAGYLAELDKAGVSYSNPTDATNAGLSICHGLENGGRFDTAIDSETAAGYSEHDAGFIVGAAVENLCPDRVPAMSQWLKNREQPPHPPSPQVPDYIPLPGAPLG